MKTLNEIKRLKLFLLITTTFLFYNACKSYHSENIENPVIDSQNSIPVTFKCDSCTERNKFVISGPVTMEFRNVKFSFQQNLYKGKYHMTYWQNGVQQIHLPFAIYKDSTNIIVVK